MPPRVELDKLRERRRALQHLRVHPRQSMNLHTAVVFMRRQLRVAQTQHANRREVPRQRRDHRRDMARRPLRPGINVESRIERPGYGYAKTCPPKRKGRSRPPTRHELALTPPPRPSPFCACSAKGRFVEFCIEQFSPLGRIDSRYMFGGWCLYCDGAVFALIADGALFLKGDSHNIPEFEARGLRAFNPFPDKPDTMKYFQAVPEIFEDIDALRHWGGGAIAASLRAKKKR